MSEETVIAENKSSKKPTKNKRPKSKLQETIEFCIPIIIAVALAFILRTFVFANAVVPTGSMLNTIQDDSFITACEPYGDFGPYVVPPDSYFMLGDNRNDSKDSRFWTNTYVKRDKIIGKVKFRYYPSIGKIQ